MFCLAPQGPIHSSVSELASALHAFINKFPAIQRQRKTIITRKKNLNECISVTLYNIKYFRLVQIQSICRQMRLKGEIFSLSLSFFFRIPVVNIEELEVLEHLYRSTGLIFL